MQGRPEVWDESKRACAEDASIDPDLWLQVLSPVMQDLKVAGSCKSLVAKWMKMMRQYSGLQQ
jgi:hypothetical protein